MIDQSEARDIVINNVERSSVMRWSDEKGFFMSSDLLKSYECLYDGTPY